MDGLFLACGEQTHFSALASSAEKIAIFSAGEARAEKCVCSPQASLFPTHMTMFVLKEIYLNIGLSHMGYLARANLICL